MNVKINNRKKYERQKFPEKNNERRNYARMNQERSKL